MQSKSFILSIIFIFICDYSLAQITIDDSTRSAERQQQIINQQDKMLEQFDRGRLLQEKRQQEPGMALDRPEVEEKQEASDDAGHEHANFRNEWALCTDGNPL